MKKKTIAAPTGINRRAPKRDSSHAWLERTNPLKGLYLPGDQYLRLCPKWRHSKAALPLRGN